LFHAYFCEGQSDRRDLIAAAVSAGLEAGQVKCLLESDEGASVAERGGTGPSAEHFRRPILHLQPAVAFSGATRNISEALCRASGHIDFETAR
jgi:hypothetical protein